MTPEATTAAEDLEDSETASAEPPADSDDGLPAWVAPVGIAAAVRRGGRDGAGPQAIRLLMLGPRLPRDLHPVAWWVWAIGLARAASFTTNPLLLLCWSAWPAVVVCARRSDQPWARSFRLYVWLGVVIVVVRVVFRISSAAASAAPCCSTCPRSRCPDWVAGIRLLGPVTPRGRCSPGCTTGCGWPRS